MKESRFQQLTFYVNLLELHFEIECGAHHNVVWDIYDGNFRLNNRETDADPAVQHHHRVYNNTCLDDWIDPNAPPVHPASDYPGGKDNYFVYAFTDQLEGTKLYNNIGVGFADKLQTLATGYEPYPATALNIANYFEVPVTERVVVARELHDFRPVNSTNIVDAGADPGIFDAGVVGEYPDPVGGGTDMGAYEYGSPEYWIPGRQLKQASVPIPYDGAVNMPLDRDLIYLIGYEGVEANVYFGTASNSMPLVVSQTTPTNVVELSGLQPDTAYYWRVDTLLENGSVVTGVVWNFTTADYAAPPLSVVFSDDFEEYATGGNPPTSNWATQVKLGAGTIQVFDMGGDNVVRLDNATTADRTVFGAVDAFSEQDLMTLSFDSYHDGATPITGPMMLSAGVASSASHLNQVQKVYLASHVTPDVWHHFDWIVNQSGSPVNYSVEDGNYTVAPGSADLWCDGVLVVDDGSNKPDNALTATTPMDSFGWTVNMADMADWRIDNVAVRNGAYVYIATPFEQWASMYGISSATNDPDNDGFINLAEFGLGSDPTNSAPTGYFPIVEKTSDGFEYVYPRRQNSGLTYWLETTTNLVSGYWTNSGYTVSPNIGIFAPGFDAITNLIDFAENEAFIRLRISEL